MTAFSLRSFVRVSALAAIVSLAQAAEPAIIDKARAFVGAEAALKRVTSIHYVGTLTTASPADPTKQTRAALEIIFQKPNQQRIMATSDAAVETTALDGYDGWQRIQDVKDSTKWRQTMLGSDQIKRLRANTWENLSFFRSGDSGGARIEDLGTKTVEGVACQEISFVHGPNIIFNRYFDLATGRLILTETEAGGTIREQGEMVVDGIRFPRSIVTTTKNAKGEMQSVTINFEKITLNENFPSATFAVPSLLVK